MPFISIQTNKSLSHEQKEEISIKAGELITIFPNKSSEKLMLNIDDQHYMYFQNKNKECMMIQVKVLGTTTIKDRENYALSLSQAVETITSLPTSDIFIVFDDYSTWGIGNNFKEV